MNTTTAPDSGLRRKMTSLDGPGWAVTDCDGAVKEGRWATKGDAVAAGLAGVYLLTGYDVVYVDA